MTVKKTVLEFLESNKPIPGTNDEEKLSCYYLDKGIIDSMGIVLMITEFEDKFSILFEAEELQSQEFQTVGGLIKIIEQKIAERK